MYELTNKFSHIVTARKVRYIKNLVNDLEKCYNKTYVDKKHTETLVKEIKKEVEGLVIE